MSDENQTEEVEAAPEAAPKKKKVNADPLAKPALLLGTLGILACIASIVVSLLF